MVFNRTSCANRHRRGFTLVEYMVATSIGLVVLAAALVSWAFAARTCASLLGYVELSNKSKVALDKVSQQIRNARRVQSCSGNTLVLALHGSATNADTATYSYDSTNKVFRETIYKSGANTTTTLLTDCTNLQFFVYQRTPISNNFELYTNGFSTNSVKVIQVQWTCARAVTGDKSSVESQVSSKIVIRNQ